MKLRIKTSLIAAGCNCQPRVCDWCHSTGLIAYAASSELDLVCYDEATGSYRAFETAAGHSGAITSLRFSRQNQASVARKQESILVTGSANSEVCIWRVEHPETEGHQLDGSLLTMLSKCTLSGDHMPVLMADAIHHRDDDLLIGVVSGNVFNLKRCGTVEGSVGPTVAEVDFVTVKHSAALILAFDWIFIDGTTTILMAIGLSSGGVDVYSLENASSKLQRKMSLPVRGAWIRDLAFTSLGNSIALATASDNIIKTWTISHPKVASDMDDGELVVKNQRLDIAMKDGLTSLEVTLESSFIAHDAPINSLRWHPSDSNLLLSSSMDKSVVLWSRSGNPQASSAPTHWLPAHRMSSEVGGEASGVYDAVFSPCGHLILFHSFFGSFHLWDLGSDENRSNDAPRPVTSFAVGGHFDSVEALEWDKNGNYLLTCSADKTTRLYGETKRGLYIEMARPQVHGHALNCIASISRPFSNCFISGGEEKIFRVFDAPSSFIERFASLAGLSELEMCEAGFAETSMAAASQGELGLSNQAAESADKTLSTSRRHIDDCHHGYPTESELSRHSLFPEVFKLYGHGFEVYAVAANHEGTLVATACKASHEEHAVIMVWETADWRRVAYLTAHQLTVLGEVRGVSEGLTFSSSALATEHGTCSP